MMSEDRHRHILWPLLLILVGVLLLLDEFGVLAFSWSTLWRLWPLALILIGLDILLSRTRSGAIAYVAVAIGLIALVLALLPQAERPRVGGTEEIYSYPARDIASATVRLEVGVGELEVSSLEDSANLYEAHISFDPRQTEITAHVETPGDEALVSLKSNHHRWTPAGSKAIDRWDVRLNSDVPLRLRVDGGLNRTHLDLRDMTLKSLDLNMGVGDVEVLLPLQGPYEANIDGGVGALRLEIPPHIPARIRIDEGLGATHVDERFQQRGRYYVSENYDAAEEAVEIDVDGGIGSITIR